MIYTTVVGAWGDMLAALGNMSLLRKQGMDDFTVIYYGYDPKIKDFLEIQYGVKEVKHYLPVSPDSYYLICAIACATDCSPLEWLKLVDPNLEFKGTLIPTHVSIGLHRNPICVRDFTCNLPYEHQGFDIPTILFQPYSVQSSPLDFHWPHWMNALDWLLDKFTKMQVVVCGLKIGKCVNGDEVPFPELPTHKRLINMVGQTESMMDVFAIADKAEMIVTTNNCLSMWSLLNGMGATVMHKKSKYPYYLKWIDCYPNAVLPFEATLEDFQDEALAYAYQEGWRI